MFELMLSPIGVTITAVAMLIGLGYFFKGAARAEVFAAGVLLVLCSLVAFRLDKVSRIHGHGWLNSRCYSSNAGWRSLALMYRDSTKEADAAISNGDKRLMFSYGQLPQLNPVNQKSSRVPGLECDREVDVKPPFGNPVYGDFLPTCRMYFLRLQGCKAQEYNRHIFSAYGNKAFPECRVSERTLC